MSSAANDEARMERLFKRLRRRPTILNARLPKRKGARQKALKQRAGVTLRPTGKFTAGWRGYNAPSMQEAP